MYPQKMWLQGCRRNIREGGREGGRLPIGDKVTLERDKPYHNPKSHNDRNRKPCFPNNSELPTHDWPRP